MFASVVFLIPHLGLIKAFYGVTGSGFLGPSKESCHIFRRRARRSDSVLGFFSAFGPCQTGSFCLVLLPGICCWNDFNGKVVGMSSS